MDRMRIAVDARPLEERPTGVGRYLEGLLTAWLADRPGDGFVLLSPRAVFVPSSLAGRVAVVPSANLPGTLWLQTAAGPAARRAGADAFFGCLGIVPLAGGPPSVATVHDVTPLLFPEWHSFKNRMGFTPLIGGSVRTARRIAVVSEHSRRDLVAHFPDAAAKTFVVHNGVEAAPVPVGGPAPNEGRPYVLSLGTLEPRKNLPRLVEAMEAIWDRRPDFPDLVLAGTEGWGLHGFSGRIASSRHAGRIRPAGYLEGGERSRWMAGARVFAYPSLYEGFGLPPLLAREAAEQAADVAADAEVAGLAAVHEDAGPRHESASSKRTRIFRALAAHVKVAARAGPFAAAQRRNASSSCARSIAAAMAAASFGSGRSPASPTTSGRDEADDATTGVPSAIASSGGRPNPS